MRLILPTGCVSTQILFGKKQGSIFGIIVLQLVASTAVLQSLQENIFFMLQSCVKTEEKQDIVFQNYFILKDLLHAHHRNKKFSTITRCCEQKISSPGREIIFEREIVLEELRESRILTSRGRRQRHVTVDFIIHQNTDPGLVMTGTTRVLD